QRTEKDSMYELSAKNDRLIRGILREFKGCIISVSHDRKYIGEACKTLYELRKEGLIKTDNPYETP
uniref:hypothetical protein n=1 Tax=Neglectibacter timonensis TaxID=1776382 RepID=UPI00266C2489